MNHHMGKTKGEINKTDEIIDGRTDRRKDSRYKVKDGIFTVPNPRIQSSRLGNIIDVSMGGLAFQYFLVKNMSFNEFSMIDIYISGDGMFLDDLPVQIVSDIELPRSEKQFMTTSKRFGVQFQGLDQAKKEKLHQFIEHNTMYKV